ncbi:MAG: hypothetical protein IKK85_05630 [Clostridia bacterium]|nr:hypothetical protein [Clostridia bacterium]
MDNNEFFQFSYSASQQEEIKNIRNKYLPAEEDKMKQLRKLDEGVTRKSSAVALAVGIIGTLLLGLGMACCLEWAEKLFIPGIIIGIIGIAAVAAAMPIYNFVTARERKKIAPEIIRLTDELLK